jgi:type IV pilus assembly protein PilX
MRSRHLQRQRGVALIISLIMLVLMTLVGMAGIRMINSEERMVSQSFDRAVAFQTAEAALREIEIQVDAARPTPAPSTACTMSGINVCGVIANGTPRWISTTFNEWADATTVVHTTGMSITPQYFVEYLGDTFPCSLDTVAASNCRRYRITARADADTNAGPGRGFVMMQSIYATPAAAAPSVPPGP